MNGRLFQYINPVNVAPSGVIAANEDIFSGSPATDVVNMSKIGKIIFFVQMNANAGVGSATITIESCDTLVPGTATAIPFVYWACTTPGTWGDLEVATASGFTTAATADNMYAMEIDARELSGTDSFVRMQLTEVGADAVDGAVWAIAGEERYNSPPKLDPLV